MTSTGAAIKRTDQEVIDFYSRSSAAAIPGVPKFDNRRLVDGQRQITFLKPLPTSSDGRDFEIRSKVLGVYDKGKAGSVVETESILAEKGGDEYTRAVGSAFFVAQLPPFFLPQRAGSRMQLNGDYNPLHATPEPGQKMGFGGAIMHGLFSWNVACHALLQSLGDSDPANIREFGARFAAPVRPGEKLVTEAWRTGEYEHGWEEIRFLTRIEGGKVALSNGRALMKCAHLRGRL
ncbi:MAG: hypothetical protein Q9220_000259 [cf. Caloplaca sp. 1 TL-2023]